jgi:endonuclease III-like uncharacterized protein
MPMNDYLLRRLKANVNVLLWWQVMHSKELLRGMAVLTNTRIRKVLRDIANEGTPQSRSVIV